MIPKEPNNAVRRRSEIRGAALVELSCSLCVLLPVVLSILLFLTGTCQTFFVQASLQSYASIAARNLAVAYGRNPDIALTRAMQDLMVLDQIRMEPVLSQSSQFEDPHFDLTSSHHSVTVRVKYPAPGCSTWIIGTPFTNGQVRATASYPLN